MVSQPPDRPDAAQPRGPAEPATDAGGVSTLSLPGIEFLKDAVDCHVHVCPHINARTISVFEATRQAAAARMRGIGLMDNFGNSSGYAALVMRELGHLGVDVFGGPILEPCAGGVSPYVVKIALDYGYGPGTGARFVSLPTHHTRNVAISEGRSPAYIEDCFHVPLSGELQDATKEVLDLIARRDIVLNTGFVSADEAARLCEEAVSRGVGRIIVPAVDHPEDMIRDIVATGAYAEFFFFGLTHATHAAGANVEAQINSPSAVSLSETAARIRAAGPDHAILSGDLGIAVLPPPVEGLREFLLTIRSAGFADDEIRTMVVRNPSRLFKVGQSASA